MTRIADYRVQAKAETTKRLIAQLINEELARLTISACGQSEIYEACISKDGDTTRRILLCVRDRNRSLGRPNDFIAPVILDSADLEVKHDDPGTIFDFISSWLDCNEKMKESIVSELRNSAIMLEKWMEYGAKKPMLNLNSPFIEWEQSVVSGHPTHPSLRDLFEIEDISTDKSIIVPCLLQQLPAVQRFFPEAKVIKSVPHCAKAQTSIRTVSVSGFELEKFSLACLITSGFRALACWAAALAVDMTYVLRKLLPSDLWIFGEVAAITGSQEDVSEARHLTCVLRESLEVRAERNDESLILVSALMEKPGNGEATYAEILFDLKTAERKIEWFKGYISCLLPLALDPLRRHGIGCEFHAQNTIVRLCRKTKSIKGFAIRDLSGVRLHGSSLKEQGFDISKFDNVSTEELPMLWNRMHHALIQNNIGFMLYAFGLENNPEGWAAVHSILSDTLESGNDLIGKEIFQHFCKETMPFKCFINMRMNALFNCVSTLPHILNVLLIRETSQ
ncbi:hypothetical protein P170DRAFT_366652 [Aspergillus steynii IBT 23096]|uniref:Aerobactin siderophore biosynthesis IucA/IucC-like C-terminal domain-containing protein n=1 Tax=Aspergillus steynii IBT 23096 TaxID=1392250 RepID=A0A2I2FVX6_9EURO|nr:uncharacterized protein P170DRAFT_366652 [Aspergillus steynii IBT 23096]PLB44790.1 hypothetical protein P170DRAFT_366652 [Aspergillus steynii IBT 23096]